MTYPHGDKNSNQGRDSRDGNGYQGSDPRGPYPRDESELDAGGMFPEGDYPVVAKGHKFGWSGNRNPQVGIRLLIVDGAHKGKTLLWYGTFTEAAQEFTIKALRALGMRGDDAERDIGQIYEGAQGIAVVKHDTYQGKTRAKVQWINGADVQMKEEMDGNDLRAFSQRMRATFARFGSGSKGPAPGPTQGQRGHQPQPSSQRDDRSRGGGSEDMPWNDPPPRDDRRR